MERGAIGSMRDLGITESYKLKRQVVLSASEAAEMIIRFAFSLCVHVVQTKPYVFMIQRG